MCVLKKQVVEVVADKKKKKKESLLLLVSCVKSCKLFWKWWREMLKVHRKVFYTVHT